MDNPSFSQNSEFKRRLIRHLETAFRHYEQQLAFIALAGHDDLATSQHIAQAQDEVIKLLAMLKR
jgi:hypothetical protein